MFSPVLGIDCKSSPYATAKGLAEHRNKSPLVFKGFCGVLGWRATSCWADPDVLRGIISDDDPHSCIPVSTILDGSKSFDSLGTHKGSVSVRTLLWREGIDSIFAVPPPTATVQVQGEPQQSQPRCYLKSPMCPPLRRYVATFPDKLLFVDPTQDQIKESDSKVWVGAAQNVTPLHFDLCHGLIVQVVGRKRVTLFHPSESAKLYPWPCSKGPPHCSQVTLLLQPMHLLNMQLVAG